MAVEDIRVHINRLVIEPAAAPRGVPTSSKLATSIGDAMRARLSGTEDARGRDNRNAIADAIADGLIRHRNVASRLSEGRRTRP